LIDGPYRVYVTIDPLGEAGGIETMKWCCEGFRKMFEQRHERTLYVFAGPPLKTESDKANYWLGMRSVSKMDIDKLLHLGIPNTIPITVSTRIPIFYCPWCGSKLANYYESTYDQLVDKEILNEFEG
jgi:hypothetical protein